MTVREWDAIHAKRGWGKWPNEVFVAWFMRTYGAVPRRELVRVLELGSGGGAQLRFLATEGFAGFGVEGSAAAISQSKQLHWDGAVVWKMDLGDFAKLPSPGTGAFKDETYDCIVDVCTLQHLTAGLNAQVVARARKMLKPGGKLFSFYTAEGSDPIYFDGVPRPHLMTQREIPHVFPGFWRDVDMVIYRNGAGPELRHWRIIGEKADG